MARHSIEIPDHISDISRREGRALFLNASTAGGVPRKLRACRCDPKKYGRISVVLSSDEAVFRASRRADALLDQGDTDGFTAWLRIVRAIETLQRKGPPEGEALN